MTTPPTSKPKELDAFIVQEEGAAEDAPYRLITARTRVKAISFATPKLTARKATPMEVIQAFRDGVHPEDASEADDPLVQPATNQPEDPQT